MDRRSSLVRPVVPGQRRRSGETACPKANAGLIMVRSTRGCQARLRPPAVRPARALLATIGMGGTGRGPGPGRWPHAGGDRVVDREPRQSTFDRDIDLRPRSLLGLTGPIESYQRLVANPLLAVSSWVVVVALIRASVQYHRFALFVAGVALFFIAFFLLQFHCLDCGSTGWLLRYGMHACPAV